MRIAQAAGEHLQFAAIRIAAKHRAGVWVVEQLPLARGDAKATVTAAEVNPSIRPKLQPVNVMAADADVNAEACGQLLFNQ